MNNVQGEMYPPLMKILFANLNHEDGIITSEVKKHQISMSLEEFSKICNPPCTISLYKLDDSDLGDGFYFDTTSRSFLLNPSG